MEFEVDEDGRFKLKRRMRFEPVHPEPPEGPFFWELTFAVEGMAGAVSVTFVGGEHKSQAPERPGMGLAMAPSTAAATGVGMVWVPSGLDVHAYRPWPTGEEGRVQGACNLLSGGRCFAQSRDGLSLLSSGELLNRLAQPGGHEHMWRRLAEAYEHELCPVGPQDERLAQLEAYAAALDRTDQPPRLSGQGERDG